jgi:N6-L-threonylcarbamoyladenine synthase
MADGPILAIETSCDDTCAAVLDGRRILSNTISSQAAAHERFGGVVPEVASRHHLELAVPVVEAALAEAGVSLDEIEAVAVTAGPGLIGALLVGISTAKALAAPRRLPLIPVDHMQGHVAANFLEPDPLEPPFLCLVASGGHTMLAAARDHSGHEILGQTLDDAAGEAIDKAARIDERRADLAASFQVAVVGQLVAKLERALKRDGWEAVALGGGVAANGPLRAAVAGLCERRGLRLKLAPPELCTDNAAMIGSAARFAPRLSYPDYLGYDAFATGEAMAAA